jgi:hypothetical protein
LFGKKFHNLEITNKNDDDNDGSYFISLSHTLFLFLERRYRGDIVRKYTSLGYKEESNNNNNNKSCS